MSRTLDSQIAKLLEWIPVIPSTFRSQFWQLGTTHKWMSGTHLLKNVQYCHLSTPLMIATTSQCPRSAQKKSSIIGPLDFFVFYMADSPSSPSSFFLFSKPDFYTSLHRYGSMGLQLCYNQALCKLATENIERFYLGKR